MAIVAKLQKGVSLEALIELSRKFFLDYETHRDEFFKMDSLRDKEIVSSFSLFLGAEDRAAFIATMEGKVIGYITVYIRPQPGYRKIKRVGHISGLRVGQAYRNQGIGRQLVNAARLFFEERGVKCWTVYTAL